MSTIIKNAEARPALDTTSSGLAPIQTANISGAPNQQRKLKAYHNWTPDSSTLLY